MRYSLLLLSVLLITLSAAGQGKDPKNIPEPYSREWAVADSLIGRGLPQSAASLIETVYNRSKRAGQPVQVLKAQLYLMRARSQYKEDSDTERIGLALQEAAAAPFPVSNIWHSILARFYQDYYNSHQWQILQRTPLAGSSGARISEWDAAQFMKTISFHYAASLVEAAALRKISLETYEPLIIRGENTRHLRPSLYDLLAFRALQFFEADESGLPLPANQFVMDDPQLLAPAAVFIQRSFNTGDTSSLLLQALQLYQGILTGHISDATPDALIDADLSRLKLIYEHAAFPDKKRWYEQALKHLAKKYGDDAAGAEVMFRLAELQAEEERDGAEENIQPAIHTRDLKAVKAALEAIVSRFPESEGGIHAAQLLLTIKQQSLALKAEEVVLPDGPSKVLLTYKNVPQVWVRLLRISQKQYLACRNSDIDSAQKSGLLLAPALKAWSISLPGTDDYETHSTELPVDAVGPGMYALLVSSQSDFSGDGTNLSVVAFQSSRISMITQNGEETMGWILDRKTGLPLAGAAIQFYTQEYNGLIYEQRKKRSASSAADGSFTTGTNESYSGTAIRFRDEVLYLTDNLNFYKGEKPSGKPGIKTFLFTDRSIYRPGQTIYFKGIMVRSESQGKKVAVLPGMNDSLFFFDVNGQKVKTLLLKTNEYGSFTGSFTAPEGVLTGQMRLADKYGYATVSVEEYKRPKFSVSFDTLKADYVLNEKVTVKGKAIAYAGNVINGAAVKYRVVRNTRWPYDWLSWRHPSSGGKEIAQGIVQTDDQGAFSVIFPAIPDAAVDPKSLPVFSYTVYADVTDAAGETRSGTQSIQAGYRSIAISAAVPEKASPSQLDSIIVRTANLNGQFVPAKVKASIALLQAPSILPRARLWEQPDQYLMDEASFKKLFPLDEYKGESNYRTWKEGFALWEREYTSDAAGLLRLPAATFNKAGWYVLTFTTTDRSGATVTDKHYVQVWSPSLPGNLATPLNTFTAQSSYEPGQTAHVAVVSGFAGAHLLQVQTDMVKGTVHTQHDFNGPALSWNRALTEADRGGVALKWVMVKENRVYTASETIAVPWSNKDLDISWETHRDRLQPGAKETWTMIVKGAKREKVAAEMVAGLYDASLDAFRDHSWDVHGLFPGVNDGAAFDGSIGFSTAEGEELQATAVHEIADYQKEYDALMGLGDEWLMDNYGILSTKVQVGNVPFLQLSQRRGEEVSSPKHMMVPAAAEADTKVANINLKNYTYLLEFNDSSPDRMYVQSGNRTEPASGTTKDIPLRKNLQETAFFFPQLKTDADGNIRIQFTMPEALTEWRFMALAHTKDMAFGQAGGSVKTQKDLMAQPALPRFFRQGDDMVIATKISNLSGAALSGKARLELVDAQTLKPLNLPFRLTANEEAFSVAKGQSTTATWRIHVPESLYEPVLVRISAGAGSFTDGEENAVPLLTNRTLVTETMPLWTNGSGTKTFRFDKLLHSDSSRTLSQYGLTLEYTPNPAWYAVQALPYLMEYPFECAEQTFNRYYANALAAHILDKAPLIKNIFRTWEASDTAALQSNLQKNPELKSALLEETPWVLEAKSEAEQKHNIALLFESYRLGRSGDATLSKLQGMLLPEGAFPWFKGMGADRYITQYIATGIARLEHLGVTNNKTKRLTAQMMAYLSRGLEADYKGLMQSKAKLQDQHIGYLQVQYLYLLSYYPAYKNDEGIEAAVRYYKMQAAAYWPTFNPYMKGMIALSLHRLGDPKTAGLVIRSLRETAIHNEETGMYWMQSGNGYWWYEAPVEAQSLLIECFREAAGDDAAVDEMKRWLLKQKQTRNWRTTRATADACYALLVTGGQWLGQSPEVVITLGDKTIRSNEQKAGAGSGYFKVHYAGSEVKPSMGNITLTTIAPAAASKSPSWGAIYWQYFENLDKITSSATPLALRKQLFIERNTDHGPVLEEVTGGHRLHVGDRVKIRIVLQADRDMEYLHLKDGRAACLEPLDVISGYRWQAGLGYYQSTRDASSNFFISYLRRGTYVFEYGVNVMAKGNFSNGIATIQCMYAPEFTSHSEGARITVE